MNIKLKPVLLVVVTCIVVGLWILFVQSLISTVELRCEEQINELSDATVKTTETSTKETKETVKETTSTTKETTTQTTTEKKTTEQATKETISKPKETEKITDFVNCSVPSNNTIKSYMDYRCITLTTSKQYKLQKSLAYTDNNGLRVVNGRYCVAVGSYYTTTIGQHIDIELANGKVIKGILADCKADVHTDSTNRINPNGSVVEFVVDVKSLDSTAKKMGDISYVNGWNSKIVNIKVYDKVEKF